LSDISSEEEEEEKKKPMIYNQAKNIWGKLKPDILTQKIDKIKAYRVTSDE
jgi:hypothetical protein